MNTSLVCTKVHFFSTPTYEKVQKSTAMQRNAFSCWSVLALDFRRSAWILKIPWEISTRIGLLVGVVYASVKMIPIRITVWIRITDFIGL